MKILPRYVKKGEPIAASEYNNLIRNQRNQVGSPASGPTVLAGIANRKENPFEVIDIRLDNESGIIFFKMKAGYIYSGSDTFEVFTPNTQEGTYAPLSLNVEQFIPTQLYNTGPTSTAWIYIDVDDFELNWHGPTEYDSSSFYIARFEFTIDGGDVTNIKYVNLYPSNIMKNTNDPFVVTPWQLHTVNEPQESAPESCNMTISNGYVWTIDPSSGSDVLIKKRVKSGLPEPSQYLDDAFSPSWEGIEPDQVIYLKVTTDDKGVVVDDPEIYIGTEEETNTHYYPDPVAADGVYYYPLAKIKRLEFEGDDGNFYQFVTEQYFTGHFIIQPDLVTIKNIGNEREIFKTYDDALNEYQFRTLQQLTGGESIIKDEVDPDALDVIKFKAISERASQPQITVESSEDDTKVIIKGNNVDEDLTDVRKFSITVKDGLISSLLKTDIGAGWWGTILWDYHPATGSPQGLELSFEDGLLVGVTCSQGTTGGGTEADPGVVVFTFSDTDT